MMLRQLLLLILKTYQTILSPLLGQRCRFYPSCSEYTMICLHRDQPLAQVFRKALARLFRCHPGNPGGLDYP